MRLRWKVLTLGLGLLALSALMVGASALGGGDITGWAAVNVVILAIVWLPVMALYVAAQAVAARALGLRVSRVILGAGRRLLSWRRGATTFGLHTLPLMSRVLLADDRPGIRRWRLWLAIAAGPLAIAGLLIAVVHVGKLEGGGFAYVPTEALLARALGVELIAVAAGFLLIIELVPMDLLVPGCPSDGSRLLRLPFDRAGAADLLAEAAVLDAEDLRTSGKTADALSLIERELVRSPTSFRLRNSLAIVYMETDRIDEARAILGALIDENHPVAWMRAVARGNLAWADFRSRREDLLEEADRESQAALAVFRSAPVKGTRGAVLTWLGRNEEAVPLLQRAYHGSDDGEGQALNACSAAIALAALGRDREAHEWLARARAAGPCFLLAEAEATVLKAAGQGR